MSDIVERARLVQRVNAHLFDSICICDECAEERFDLITPMADEIESLRSRLAAEQASHDRDGKALKEARDRLGAVEKERDVLLEIRNEIMRQRTVAENRLAAAEGLLREVTDRVPLWDVGIECGDLGNRIDAFLSAAPEGEKAAASQPEAAGK